MKAVSEYRSNYEGSALGSSVFDSISNSVRRPWLCPNLSIVLIIGFGLFCSVSARRLASQMRENPSPPLLAPSTSSDAAAKAALQQMVTASGGSQVWGTLGSSILRYRITGSSNTQPADRLMLDDWSSDKTRYRRGYQGMTGHPVEHNGRADLHVVSPKDKKKTITIQEFDQARVLASHIPAAAALVILRNSAYIAKTRPECPAQKVCVTIYRRAAPKDPFQCEEQWTLDVTTHLPEEVSLLLPSVLPDARRAWKSTLFYDYRSEQGVQLPHRIVFRIQGLEGPHQELVSARFSTGFDTAVFDQEMGK